MSSLRGRQTSGTSAVKKGGRSCLEEMEEDQQELVVEAEEGPGWVHPASARTTTHELVSASAAIACARTVANASPISAVSPATRSNVPVAAP